MRRILSTVVCFMVWIFAEAEIMDLRHHAIVVLDTAINEVVYAHIAVDPVKKKQEVKYEMLTLGRKIRHYGGYENYQQDSIYMSDPEFNPTGSDYIKWARQFETLREEVVIYPEEDKLEYLGTIFINHYRYAEPIPEIDWTICDEIKEIFGRQCTKATATWRGRDWIAWFCDIAIDAGPWKFQGLPGLILKLEDSSGEHMFEAIGFKGDVFPFGYNDNLICKTTREKFELEYKNYCENFSDIIIDSGLATPLNNSTNRRKKKRRFYAPIEIVAE